MSGLLRNGKTVEEEGLSNPRQNRRRAPASIQDLTVPISITM